MEGAGAQSEPLEGREAGHVSYGDLYDEILRQEFGEAGSFGGAARSRSQGSALVDKAMEARTEVVAGEVPAEVRAEVEGEEESEVVPMAAARRRMRYGGAAAIALGGAACAAIGGLLGGLGAGTTVIPAAVHSMAGGRSNPGANLPSGLPALATTPLDHTSLVGDRLPLLAAPLGPGAVGGPAAGPVAGGPFTTTTTTSTTTTTTTAPSNPAPPPASTSTPGPSSPGTPNLPAPVSGLDGVLATVGNTVHHVVSQLTSGLSTSSGQSTDASSTTAPSASSCTSGSHPVSGAQSSVGSLPVGSVTGGSTSSGSCTR